MSNLKFSLIEVASKHFCQYRQITDIFTIDVKKVVISDKVSYNNGKSRRYIVGYQVDGKTIKPLFIKTLKNIFSYDVSQYNKNSTYTKTFNVSRVLKCVLQYRNIWNEVESKLFEKLTA